MSIGILNETRKKTNIAAKSKTKCFMKPTKDKCIVFFTNIKYVIKNMQLYTKEIPIAITSVFRLKIPIKTAIINNVKLMIPHKKVLFVFSIPKKTDPATQNNICAHIQVASTLNSGMEFSQLNPNNIRMISFEAQKQIVEIRIPAQDKTFKREINLLQRAFQSFLYPLT